MRNRLDIQLQIIFHFFVFHDCWSSLDPLHLPYTPLHPPETPGPDLDSLDAPAPCLDPY